MYGHYCCHNYNMNWLMGVGLLFNTIGNMFSARQQRAYYPTYNMPVFSYPSYPVNISYQSQTNNPFLVGNLLAGINTEAVPVSYPAQNSSLASIVQQAKQKPQQDNNLVGNTLSDIANSQKTLPTHPPVAAVSVKHKKIDKTAITPPTTRKIETNLPKRNETIGNDNTIIRNGDRVKISKDIENKIKQIAARVNCDYKDLMGVIWAESRFNPKAWNGKTAVGLIQFTQICIDDLNQVYGLNITKQKIEKMSALEQLELVEKSLIRAKQVAGLPQNYRMNAAELYTINFLPARLKTHATKGYLTKRGENFYAENKGADLNKDGFITKNELNTFVQTGKKHVTTIA